MKLCGVLGLCVVMACGDDDGAVDAGEDATMADVGVDAGDDDAGDDDAGDQDAGDAGGDAGADAGVDPVTAYCESVIARDERCGETPPTLADCAAEQSCTLNVIFRSDAAAAVTTCIDELECGSSDDPCFTASGLGLDPSPGAADFTSACTMRREECGGSFSDDFCFFDLAADGIFPMLDACLEQECDTVGDCLLGVVLCEE